MFCQIGDEKLYRQMPLYDAYGTPIPSTDAAAGNHKSENQVRPKRSRLQTTFKRIGAWFPAITSVLSFGDLLCDVFFGRHLWPSSPNIEAHNSANNSSLVLPFHIRNAGMFPLKNTVRNILSHK